jgi:hypothetical protein
MIFRLLISVLAIAFATAFSTSPIFRQRHSASTSVLQAEVEIIFPNGKKAKAATGSNSNLFL